jgi:hypothetical protein
MNRRAPRKRETWGLSVLAAIAALAISGPASGGFEGEIQGGKGGGFFKVICPPGQFWVGAVGRAGVVIDNMKLLCEQFRTVKSIPPRKNWKVVPPVRNERPRIGGSGGGTALTRQCTNDRFVRLITFNTEFFEGHHLIAFIRMTCEHGTFSGFDELTFGFNTPVGTGPQVQACPQGEYAIGLKGRQGDFIDAIALICAPMPPF